MGTAHRPVTGVPLQRVEDEALLRGAALFTADIDTPALAGALYATFVRSPHAAAAISSVDGAEAARASGVVEVFTGMDLDGDTPVPFALPIDDAGAQPLLPTREVSFVGQVVAMVVAETAAQASDAAELVVVEYEPIEPVLDLDDAVQQTVIESTRFRAGSRATHSESADVRVALRTWSPRQVPSAIEARSVAAVWNDGQLTVWAATQTPHAYRNNLAAQFAVGIDDIRVIAPQVGGGFGGKVSRSAEEFLIPLAAHRQEKPVRWNESRSEHFATATQGRGERIDAALAGTSGGQFETLRVELVKDAGAFPLVGVMLPAGFTTFIANGCYDIAEVEFASLAARTNLPSTSAYRGAGRGPMIGALERAVDVFAARVGLDPAEIRRRNLVRPEQMPYETPTGGLYDEADYPAAFERALELAGYDELRQQQAARRSGGSEREIGIGIACYNHMTMGGGGEAAEVTVHPDGSATVVTGATSQGHGHATTWSQIAADVLRIPTEHISVVEGDTAAIATGIGAVGSRSAQTAGIAVHRASAEIVERARELAAQLLEAASDDVVQSDDSGSPGFHVVGTPARVVEWGELADAGLGTDHELSCGDVFGAGKNTYPSGTHVAVVEVDTDTGAWDLVRFVSVDDAGTVINPLIVDGQLHGGLASGIGQVLGEVMTYDADGTPLTSNFGDYLLPSPDQLPSFETEHAPTPTSVNTLGVKGVGESGTIGATAATHNAVIDAVAHRGVEHIDLPCTPLRVWEALHHQARSRSRGDNRASPGRSARPWPGLRRHWPR